jgi:pimeloyl-ACP methyl ester carboxylesterase
MPYADINGIKIYYETHGQGFPLVLIQGFTRNLHNWNGLINILKNDFQLILLDNRGSGQTQQPSPPYSIDLMADDVIALLEFLKIKKAHIAGHSMGGAIVQQVCLYSPHLVEKGVICSSFTKVPYTSLMQIDTILDMAKAEIPQEFIYRMVLPWLYSSACLQNKQTQEAIIEKMIHDPYPQQLEGFLGQAEALKSFNSQDIISKIETPVLILTGELDLYAPASLSEEMKNKIKKAQLKRYPQQGHMIIEEIPEIVAADMLAFLKD